MRAICVTAPFRPQFTSKPPSPTILGGEGVDDSGVLFEVVDIGDDALHVDNGNNEHGVGSCDILALGEGEGALHADDNIDTNNDSDVPSNDGDAIVSIIGTIDVDSILVVGDALVTINSSDAVGASCDGSDLVVIGDSGASLSDDALGTGGSHNRRCKLPQHERPVLSSGDSGALTA
jgi:hypothetical protein